MSRYCLMSAVLPSTGRTIALTGYGPSACSCASTVCTLFGTCSPSTSSQSKPAVATTSAAYGSASASQSPTCGSRRRSAALKALTGSFIAASGEMEVDRAERPVVDVEGVAANRCGRPRERAAEDDVARFEPLAVGGDLVREPGDAVAGMVEHAGGEPGLL